MTSFYAGIGSRSTPPSILFAMTRIAEYLYQRSWCLRSGGAGGADIAFEAGAGDQKQIFLPWPGFNGRSANGRTVFVNASPQAFDIASAHHPAWYACSPAARKLHARNSHQVLGLYLNEPAQFVICWTPGATGSGGTGQAIRIAKAHDIPVFDLADDAVYSKWMIALTTGLVDQFEL